MKKFKKGDHVVYTGPYDKSIHTRYPPGVIVGFKNNKSKVIVRLDGDELYADWPVDEIAEAPLASEN